MLIRYGTDGSELGTSSQKLSNSNQFFEMKIWLNSIQIRALNAMVWLCQGHMTELFFNRTNILIALSTK